MKKKELMANKFLSYKIDENNPKSNCIYFDGIGFCVDIFEFMDNDCPMYSSLTRFKNFQDAKKAAKIINCNNLNFEDCIKLIPNYMNKQI